MAAYYILDNVGSFNLCNNECYDAHIAEFGDNSGYIETTKSWAFEFQRLTDLKYICPVCDSYSNPHGFPVEESQANWFPVDD